MKLVIEFTQDSQYKEYKVGDTGFIDGYIQGADNRPYAVIHMFASENVVLAPTYSFKSNRMLVFEDGLLIIKPL